MRYSIHLAGCLALLFLFSACGPTPPPEAEVRAKLVGTYCADNYKLEIREDNTYKNRKRLKSMLGSNLLTESCRSTYELVLEDDQWIIRFAKDEHPQAVFKDCGGEYVVWTKEEEYTIGNENKVQIKDRFDGVLLTKGPCN